MLTVALTGSLGAGKSTVAYLLENEGATVISADAVGHRLIAPGGVAYDEVVQRYGERVLAQDGAIDRAALGRIVFGDPEELLYYNNIVHPHLVADLLDELERRRNDPGVLVVDAALVYEWGIEHEFDLIVVVAADTPVRQQRIQRREGLGADEFEKRDRAQAGPQSGDRAPDLIIQNDGDFDALQQQVRRFWERLRKSQRGGSPRSRD